MLLVHADTAFCIHYTTSCGSGHSDSKPGACAGRYSRRIPQDTCCGQGNILFWARQYECACHYFGQGNTNVHVTCEEPLEEVSPSSLLRGLPISGASRFLLAVTGQSTGPCRWLANRARLVGAGPRCALPLGLASCNRQRLERFQKDDSDDQCFIR